MIHVLPLWDDPKLSSEKLKDSMLKMFAYTKKNCKHGFTRAFCVYFINC